MKRIIPPSSPLSPRFPGISQAIPILGSVAIGLCFTTALRSAVPSGDVTLQNVVSANLPVVATITGYGDVESEMKSWSQLPLFAPYEAMTDAWWDNLVSEQLQARMPVVMLNTCGTYTTDPACLTGPGGMNPYRLKSYIDALNRANAANKVKLACFIEGGVQAIYTNYYHLAAGTPVDLSNSDSWNQVWWLRVIKPWLDTVPSSYWYTIGGKFPIEFWGLNIPSIYGNTQGNISQLCNFIASQMVATYGVSPFFIMGSQGCDTTLAGCASMMGDNEWFAPPARAFTSTLYKNFRIVGMVPGYIDKGFYDPTSSMYGNQNGFMPRNGVDKANPGAFGDTMRLGLDAAYAQAAPLVVIEGFTDVSESCAMYRSLSSMWDRPNQYLNILRSYCDLRTATLRLDAEACDEFGDTTAGNSGGSFLRGTQDLDVRALTGAPATSCSSETSPWLGALAFDGSFAVGSKWMSGPAAPGWLQYNFGSRNSVVVTAYTLTSADDHPERDPAVWQFQGSNDGTNWTVLDTQSGQVFANRIQSNVYPIANTTAYQYYRLNVTALAGAGNHIQLTELSFTKAASTQPRGWAVTNTAAGEWLQFDGLTLSAGNYKFPICYSSTAAHTVRLYVDGTALPDVVLPSTGSVNTFTTAYLGSAPVSHGAHTLKVYFVDGGLDVDWIFIKKYDSMMAFKSPVNNLYLSAQKGGNNTASNAVLASGTGAGIWERMSVNDLAGAGTVTSGDTITPQVYNGCYLTAVSGGGSTLTTGQRVPGAFENFTIVKTAGSGTIANGDLVALRTSGGKYVTVNSDGTVNATATTIGTAQTFTVAITTQQ
jgi:hypothetical protein